MSRGVLPGPDGRLRCRWCVGVDAFVPYHDQEWGFAVADDIRLFEMLCLESFQSGLSWRTILAKRDNFRAAFDGFDFRRIATYGVAQVNRLLADAGIVRHRGKIDAVTNNARRACELVDAEGSLAAFVWRFEPEGVESASSPSPASVALSRELKRRGWAFVGPTTVHAFMQAMGLINDHADGCVTRAAVASARRRFVKPTVQGQVPDATPLVEVKNLGPKSAAALQRAGISSLDELRRVGAVQAWVQAKAVETSVSLNLLWALEGVLLGQTWQTVAREHRTRLLMSLDDLQRRQPRALATETSAARRSTRRSSCPAPMRRSSQR
jgi:DNA-3-methyladenine glycosylase I